LAAQKFEQLSHGQRQLALIARAMVKSPLLLMLDEPSLGLAPMIVQKIFEIIKNVNETEGVTILLVEQNANLALQASKRGYVLETGSVTMEDEAAKLLHNKEIRKAYLGE
jgi:branched-chain amino acid transport system ATP-binding protein